MTLPRSGPSIHRYSRAALGCTLASLIALGSGGLARPAAAQGAAPTCQQILELPLHDFGDARSVLARALGITTGSPARGSGFFSSAVRSAPVCADAAPFVRAWAGESAVAGAVGAADPDGVALQPAPLRATLVENSAFPRDRNNGSMWGGVGLNAQLEGGVEGRWRWVSAALIPKYVHHENGQHPSITLFTAGRIDAPKRFGIESFTTFDLGQSYVGAAVGPMEARLSTENLWLGAAQLSPLLLSNTAPGFPHFRLGTARPIDVRVGSLELSVLWGSLHESDYFDLDSKNDSHLFTGTVLVFEPRFLPGLYLGGARVYHDPVRAAGHSLDFYLSLLWESPLFVSGGNREGNGIGALFARWVLPASDFEVYFEWGRDDTPYNLQDLIREPDWTQAYMFGFQKVFVSPERLVRFYGEVIHLGESTPVRSGKGQNTFYTHGSVPQGHTHRGQLLGAGVGLGSDSRSLGVDVFDGSSRSGIWIEHARYDEDTYYRTFARRFGEARHNVELSAEARHHRMYRGVEAELLLRVNRQYDRDFITLVAELPPAAETNWGTELRVRWKPPRLF